MQINCTISLASSSPRRIQLLQSVCKDLEIIPPEIDEHIHKLPPKDYVLAMAEKKALDVIYKANKNIIVAADTIVVLENKIFGKPENAEDAKKMIKNLQGKAHLVYTGVFVVKLTDTPTTEHPGIIRKFVEISTVKIKPMNDKQIDDYIKNANWQDKAGAYGIQETPEIIENYNGDYNNIVGLPLDKTTEIINRLIHTHILEIDDIALPESTGVTRLENFVMFVPDTIPGDVGEIRLVKKKSSYGKGALEVLVKSSPRRVNPKCPHFGMCGGCVMQNCNYSSQLEYKQKWITDNLHKSLEQKPVIHQISPSPGIWHFRNKMEFAFGYDKHDAICLGLHKAGSFREIINIKECEIFSPKIGEILDFIREYAEKSTLLAYVPVPPYRNYNQPQGFWRYVSVRKSSAENTFLVNIMTTAENKQVINTLASGLMEKFESVKGVMWSFAPRKSDSAAPDKIELVKGEAVLKEKIGQYSYKFGVSSFIQTNIGVTKNIYDKISSFLKPEDTVLDLYTGIGSIAIYVANKVKSVMGIEISEESIKWAEINAELNNVKNVTFLQGDVKNVLEDLIIASVEEQPSVGNRASLPTEGMVCSSSEEIPDCHLRSVGAGQASQPPQSSSFDGLRFPLTVLLDPPRGGITKKTIDRIIKLNPSKIIYLSCQPATLARDLGYFEEQGFLTTEIYPFDMFPHTGHIETLALLFPKK